VLVEPESWGLALSSCVHLNPVRIQALGLDKGAPAQQRLGVDDFWVVRLNAAGETVWSKSFGDRTRTALPASELPERAFYLNDLVAYDARWLNERTS